ncbi:TM2 domain-containing protein 3-like [Oopsacas minuta]|uniref:TM2 domain-containing protein 3-like n=1 Tax=Oopsacas minuta TaxID=111878 RepID=A0AAV7JF08_9METZ|nr:TM2 domain-containing protein 3-like [Oopsacas minuta]
MHFFPSLILLITILFIHFSYVLTCTTVDDCVSFSIRNYTKYISCNDSECTCDVTPDCFESDTSSDFPCSLIQCKEYEYINDSCTDKTHNFITLLVVTVSAGYVGAANFYEGNYLTGSFQLALFTLCLILSCTICWLQCATCCGGDNDVPKCILYVLYLIFILIILVLSLAMSAWWVADIIILVLGDKQDGDGCDIIPQF